LANVGAMKVSAENGRRLWIAGGILAVFAGVGFFVLPPIVKAQVEKRASATLGRVVNVEAVRVNPFALSLTLEGFSIREKDGTNEFLGWRRLYLRLDPLRSLWSAWGLSEVDLDGFSARVLLGPDKAFNFADLLARFAVPAAKPATRGRPIRIGHLSVTGAKVVFEDRSRKEPFATSVGPMTFTLSGFSTAPQPGAPYRFDAVTEAGERFAWSGTLEAAPLGSVGDFRIESIDLPKYAPYYADWVNVDLASGSLSLSGHYELSLAEGSPVLRLTEGKVAVRALKVSEKGSREVAVDLPSINMEGIRADALARKADIESVSIAGGRLGVRRSQEGTINLLAMVAPREEPAPASGPGPAGSSAMPQATIEKVEVRDLEVALTDLAGPRPAHLDLTHIQATVANATLAPGASIPVQLAFDWAPQGSVKVGGEVGLAPVRAKLTVDVARLALLPLSPYLEQVVNARISGGALTTSLAVDGLLPESGKPRANVAGDVEVADLGLVDGAHSDDLAGFRSLRMQGVRAATEPEPSLSVGELSVDGPYVRAIVNPDLTVNLLTVMPAPAKGAPAPSSAPAALPRVEIGKVTVQGGALHFVDRSIEPNAAMDIETFAGTISGLSSTHVAKADVSLSAVVGGSGPVTIAGKLDPLGARKLVDLAIDCKNVDLVPLSPYSGKYAGYEIARGKLGMAIKLMVDDDTINATDVITLDRFTFGEPVASKDATGLPVRLGVALLKDVNGKIVVDVPIDGRLDDPDFRIGKVVVRVIVNLLTKAAVSPFALLGSMFGGGGDELGYQEFQPGQAELQAGEIKKLETMTRALANRPGLSVDLEGNYDPAADAYALKRAKLAADVRKAIWTREHQADPNIAPPGQLLITPEQSAAMIKTLFDQAFPPGTKFGTPLPRPPEVVRPPPAPQSFLRRLTAFLTLQEIQEKRRTEEENKRRQTAYTQSVASAEAAGLPVEEMSARLAETKEVTPDDLRALAARRAEAVRRYFVETGHIDAGRLFLAKVTDGSTISRGPRVVLSLQ
jgi:hypothetical protein